MTYSDWFDYCLFVGICLLAAVCEGLLLVFLGRIAYETCRTIAMVLVFVAG